MLRPIRIAPGTATLLRLAAAVLLAAPLLLIGGPVAPAPGRQVAAAPGFPDVPPGHPYYAAITELAARGIIRGYQDGRFGPDDSTLRAQMAALIARAMGWDEEDHGTPFPDRGPVDADLWRNVGTLAHYDVARGYPDGRYRPLDTVLYAQVISFITRAMVAKDYWQPETADTPSLYPNVSFASGHRWDLLTYHRHVGAIPGANPTATWSSWDRPATRGWFAQALWQALGAYVSGTWLVTTSGDEVRIAYGSGADFPQYAALHRGDSYLRFTYGPSAGWGTSLILLPVFWSAAACPPPAGLCQGAPVDANWRTQGPDLVLAVSGTIGTLGVTVTVRLLPPMRSAMLRAHVAVRVAGTAPLDPRPGEAFKPVTLSSMHISATVWDAQAAVVDCQAVPLPDQGWILQPPASGTAFALLGGTSAWKANAPTIAVALDGAPLALTGWVTPSADPNDDNVGFWAAADAVLPSWSYWVHAAPAVPGC